MPPDEDYWLRNFMVINMPECFGDFIYDIGGDIDSYTIDLNIKEGADIIIAVGFINPKLPNVSSPGNFINQMFTILINELLKLKMAFYSLAHHSEIIMIIPEFKEDIQLTETNRIPEIVALGEEETKKHIDYIKRLIDSKLG